MPATATTLIATTTHGASTGNYDGSSVAFQSVSAKATWTLGQPQAKEDGGVERSFKSRRDLRKP